MPTAGFFRFGWTARNKNRDQVLQHQHAERDAARERFEFAFVVEDFDDDDRAAHRRRDREIKRLQPVAAETGDAEEKPAQGNAAEDLSRRRERDDFARAEHFFQVNLQPDHEQQQHQADAGNGFDGMRIRHPFETVRADGKPATR